MDSIVGSGRPIAIIYFGDGSTSISDRDRVVLKNVLLLQQQQGGRLRVVGHASERTASSDNAQSQAANDKVSLARADAVSRALVGLGAPDGSVAVSAVGATQPLYDESMPTGEAGNRRVEVFLDR